MSVYRVSHTHMDELCFSKWKVTRTDGAEVVTILENVSYSEANDWCLEHIADDDIYEEYTELPIVKDGAALRKNREEWLEAFEAVRHKRLN